MISDWIVWWNDLHQLDRMYLLVPHNSHNSSFNFVQRTKIKIEVIVFMSPFCRRGFVFGLWSACASVGNILGAFLASMVLKYGYEVGPSNFQFGWYHFVPLCASLRWPCTLLLFAVCLPGDLPGAVCRRGGGVFRPANLTKGSWLVANGTLTHNCGVKSNP